MKVDLSERVGTLEDEVQALDSRIDSRTRLLWQAIQKIQAELEELKQGAATRQGE